MADLALIESKETAKAAQAFADYVNLGPERSLAKLADKYGRPPSYVRQLQRWSTEYQWQERLKEMASTQIESAHHMRLELYLAMMGEYHRRFVQDPIRLQLTMIDTINSIYDRVRPPEVQRFDIDTTARIELIRVDPDSV